MLFKAEWVVSCESWVFYDFIEVRIGGRLAFQLTKSVSIVHRFQPSDIEALWNIERFNLIFEYLILLFGALVPLEKAYPYHQIFTLWDLVRRWWLAVAFVRQCFWIFDVIIIRGDRIGEWLVWGRIILNLRQPELGPLALIGRHVSLTLLKRCVPNLVLLGRFSCILRHAAHFLYSQL